MRIAFFGGSFDPPHLGHLAVARAAQQALQLDQVLFAPVGLQPLKPAGHAASFEDRVAMTRLAICDNPVFEISLIDAPNSNTKGPNGAPPNYTIDTLTQLRQSLSPGTQLFLLLGADAFRSLPHWHRASDLPFLATLVVASRPGQNFDAAADLSACLPPAVTLIQQSQSAMQRADSIQPIQQIHHRLRNTAGAEADLYLLPNLNYDISATALRREIHQHPGTQPTLLPPAVLQYIHQHHLYQ
jgi:nicotinate-nucleotide adenylyltransferase